MKDFKTVHFIGIGGAGMSGIARVLVEMGYEITGSDLKESHYTKSLRGLGARVSIGHRPENVGKAELVVVSSAIPSDNSELKEAKKRKIPVYRRAEMIAHLGEGKKIIAVAGTHGKTTTTSMVSVVLERGGLEPTFLIGGELNDIGSNARFGEGDYLVVEADESDGSLLFLNPAAVVITNVEADHLDYFHDFAQIEEVFGQFLNQVHPDGFIIVCGDHSNLRKILSSLPRDSFTYGFENNCDFQARNIKLRKDGSSFEFFYRGKKIGRIELKIIGIHNVYNALAATSLAFLLGVDIKRISQALIDFRGVKRRFEQKGFWNGVCLADDYAHHPTEIKATLEAAQHGGWQRVICVFQPHRYTRTQALSDEFGRCFDLADIVVLTDIYAAGEEPIPGVTGKLILEAVLNRAPRKQLVYLSKFSEIKDWLIKNVRSGDLVLTMGAGDIWMVGEEFTSYMNANEGGT